MNLLMGNLEQYFSERRDCCEVRPLRSFTVPISARTIAAVMDITIYMTIGLSPARTQDACIDGLLAQPLVGGN